MVRTAAEAEAWARGPGRVRTAYNGNWAGGCVPFIGNALFGPDGYATNWYSTALDAFRKSGGTVESNRWDLAPEGAIHWWNNVVENVPGLGVVDCGHVAVQRGAQLLMATDAVTTNFGNNSGLISWQDYHKRKTGPKYIGWSRKFGTYTPIIGARSTGGTVSPPIPVQEDDMVIISFRSNNFRNGVVLAGAGYWHSFTAEEWAQFANQVKNVQVITPVNDRAWDLYHDVFTKNSAA